MNLSPDCRSQHNLLLVGLTQWKPKTLDKILSSFGALGDFVVGDEAHNLFRVSGSCCAGVQGIALCSGVPGATWLPHAWAPAFVTSVTVVFVRLMMPRKNPASALALAQLDLSIQSPHRGTLRISPLLRMTPRKSYHDFALDGMHAIKNIMSAIFAALCGQVMKPPRQPAGMDFTLDASVGTSRAMTSRRSAYLRKIKFPTVINTGTLQTSGADSTPRHTF